MRRLIILLGVLILLLTGCAAPVITPDYSLYNDNTLNETWLGGMWHTEAIHPEYDEPFNVFEFSEENGEPKLFVYNLVISEGLPAYEIYEYDIVLEDYQIIEDKFLIHRVNLVGSRYSENLHGERTKVLVYITLYYSYVTKNNILLEANFYTVNEDGESGYVFDKALFNLFRDNVVIPNL